MKVILPIPRHVLLRYTHKNTTTSFLLHFSHSVSTLRGPRVPGKKDKEVDILIFSTSLQTHREEPSDLSLTYSLLPPSSPQAPTHESRLRKMNKLISLYA